MAEYDPKDKVHLELDMSNEAWDYILAECEAHVKDPPAWEAWYTLYRVLEVARAHDVAIVEVLDGAWQWVCSCGQSQTYDYAGASSDERRTWAEEAGMAHVLPIKEPT